MITADRRKSMFLGNCKTVDGSVPTAVEITDTSKGSLELVRGSKLPVKDGKDMTAHEVRVSVKTFRLQSVSWGVGKLHTSLS